MIKLKTDSICNIDPRPNAGTQLLGAMEKLGEVENICVMEEEYHYRFDAKLFKRAQENDPVLKHVKVTEEGPWIRHRGILYIKRPGIKHKEVKVTVVPQILQQPILEHYHGRITGPHFGRKKLYMMLK